MTAEQLREAQQRMLEDMTPEQREELERWAQAERAESGEGGTGADRVVRERRTDDLDLRRPTEENRDERVVGQTTDPTGLPRAEGAETARIASPAEALQRIERVRNPDERAIAREPIPRDRQDAVDRYFQRVIERLQKQQESEAPAPAPAPPARDTPAPAARDAS